MHTWQESFVVALIITCSSAWADGYKCVAPDGSVSFQSGQCSSGKQEPLDAKGRTPALAPGTAEKTSSASAFDVAVNENYLHDMAVRCPLNQDAEFMMEVVVMTLAPITKKLSAEQLSTAEASANRRAAVALGSNKETNCKAAQSKIEAIANALQQAQVQQRP